MADSRPGPSKPTPPSMSTEAATTGTSLVGKLKKKKKKSKKRKTVQPYVAEQDDSSQTADPTRPSLTGSTSHSHARESFYRLGRAHDSNDSLRSDALLDHRDSGPLQARRQSIQHGLYGSNSQSRGGFPFGRLARNGSGSRLSRTGTAPPDFGNDSDHADDNTPLLGYGDNRGDGRGRYHSTASAIGARIAGVLRRPSRGSSNDRNESPRRPKLLDSNRSGNLLDDYDVNNPPSVPGSPILDPSRDYNDAVFVDQETGDTIVDFDGSPRLEPEVETPGSAIKRRMTVAAEEDVCFPQDILSEIAEEDLIRQEPGEQPVRRHRRRRKRWPDIEVLEAWRREEKEEREFGETRARRVNEPLLVEGRLRPKKVAWQRETEYAPFRFTYFNEQFESTIHSQTISELAQPGQSFDDLFNPKPPVLEDSSSESDDEQPAQSTLQAHDNERTMSLNSTVQSSVQKSSDLLRSSTNKTLVNSNSASGTATPVPDHSNSTPEKTVRYGSKPVFWLDVLQPTEDEMKVIAKSFGLHPLTAEDITQQDPREKVELFKNYYFIVYRSFEQDVNREDYLEPVNMYVAVFRDCILSFHFSPCPHPANVRRRCRQLSDYIICTPDWLSYGLIDDITDAYGPLIQSIEEEVDDIDERILTMYSDIGEVSEKKRKGEEARISNDILRDIGECRKKVMSLYRLLGAKADVIKGFAKRCNEQWEVAPRSDIGMYLGDIQDHIVTMTGNLSHYENLLSRAHTNYLTQINLRMNERAEKTNDVLGKLTVLGTIVLPMNIVTGLWGMNVRVPGENGEDGDLAWFIGITSSIIVVGLFFYIVAKNIFKLV